MNDHPRFTVNRYDICPECGGSGEIENGFYADLYEQLEIRTMEKGRVLEDEEVAKLTKAYWDSILPASDRELGLFPPVRIMCGECEGEGVIQSETSLLDALKALRYCMPSAVKPLPRPEPEPIDKGVYGPVRACVKPLPRPEPAPMEKHNINVPFGVWGRNNEWSPNKNLGMTPWAQFTHNLSGGRIMTVDKASFGDKPESCPSCGAVGDWLVKTHSGTQPCPLGGNVDVDVDEFECGICHAGWSE